MVSFEDSFAEVGHRLGRLMLSPEPVEVAVLPAALAARESVLQLLDAIAADGALGRRAMTADIGEVVRNPTGTMNRFRTELPRLAVPQSHDLLSVDPTTALEDLWLGVHRHAVVARHEWQTAQRASRPSGERSWPTTADGAAVLGAITALDRRLVAPLEAAGRTEDARALQESSLSPLSVVAAVVRDVASTGDLSDPAPVRKDAPTVPVAVRSNVSLREGLTRLGALLREEPDVSPRALSVVLALHGKALAAAAHLVEDPDLGQQLTAHAGQARVVADRLAAVQTIHSGGRAAVLQAHQIQVFIDSQLTDTRHPDAGLVLAHGAPAVSAALSQCAGRQVREGRWLIADGEQHDGPLWVQADIGDRKPEVLAHLADLERRADGVAVLAGPAPRAGPAPARRLPPRESLVGPLSLPEVSGRRPLAPADRLAPPRRAGGVELGQVVEPNPAAEAPALSPYRASFPHPATEATRRVPGDAPPSVKRASASPERGRRKGKGR